MAATSIGKIQADQPEGIYQPTKKERPSPNGIKEVDPVTSQLAKYLAMGTRQSELTLGANFSLIKLGEIRISISAEYLEVVNWSDMGLITQLTQ